MVAGETGERLDRDIGCAVQDPPGRGEHLHAPLLDQEQTRAGADCAAEVDPEGAVVKVRIDADRAPTHEEHEKREYHERDAGEFSRGQVVTQDADRHRREQGDPADQECLHERERRLRERGDTDRPPGDPEDAADQPGTFGPMTGVRQTQKGAPTREHRGSRWRRPPCGVRSPRRGPAARIGRSAGSARSRR